MFVGDEVLVDVGFAVARERLARLAHSSVLISASEDAYGHGTAGLARVGPPGLSKLVRVQARELARTNGSAGLAVRWEATGPSGLFPVLDADITLVPSGEHATRLTMAGAYRPPLGLLGQALDRAVLHRVAATTVRGFLARVAAWISAQPDAMEASAPNGAGASPAPGTS